jgi:hypothetical protein
MSASCRAGGVRTAGTGTALAPTGSPPPDPCPQAPGSTVNFTIAVPRHLASLRELCTSSTVYPGQQQDECLLLAVSKTQLQLVTAQARPMSGPAGCRPVVAAPLRDTAFSLQYYERTVANGATTFTFLLGVQAASFCRRAKAHCGGACSWSLFVRDSLTSTISTSLENRQLGASAFVTTGSNSSVTWATSQGPDTAETYKVTVPGDVSLAQLCRPGALASQGVKQCAAVINGPSVYAMAAFDDSDVIIKQGGAAPRPGDVCPAYKPLGASCLSIKTSRYVGAAAGAALPAAACGARAPRPAGAAARPRPGPRPPPPAARPQVGVLDNTTFQLYVANDGASSGCLREQPGDMLSLRLLLDTSAVEDLKARQQFSPREAAALDSANGITWQYTPTAGMSIHYILNFRASQDLGSVCRQNALPGQPPNTCVVELTSPALCLRGFISVDALVLDPQLIPEIPNHPVISIPQPPLPQVPQTGLSPGAIAGIVLGTVLPVLLLAGLAVWYVAVHRKRLAAATVGAGGAAGAAAPGPYAGADGEEGLLSPAHSDTSINLPGPPGASSNIG